MPHMKHPNHERGDTVTIPPIYQPPRIQRTAPASYRLINSIVVGESLQSTFDFCRDTRFLDKISPPRLRFRPRGRLDVRIRKGTEIEYDMRLHGIPVRWRSRIPVFHPPNRFVDEQTIGPYSQWKHLHTFKAIDDRNTEIGDLVDYTLPGGRILASIAQTLFVARDLISIFKYRSLKYRDYLGSPIF